MKITQSKLTEWIYFLFQMSRLHCTLLALTVLPLVSGWGGLFTKFNPGLFGQFGLGDEGSGLNTVQDDSGNVRKISTDMTFKEVSF